MTQKEEIARLEAENSQLRGWLSVESCNDDTCTHRQLMESRAALADKDRRCPANEHREILVNVIRERDRLKAENMRLRGVATELADMAGLHGDWGIVDGKIVGLKKELREAKATACRYMEEAVRHRDERNALIDELADLYQERWDYGDDEEWFIEEVTK